MEFAKKKSRSWEPRVPSHFFLFWDLLGGREPCFSFSFYLLLCLFVCLLRLFVYYVYFSISHIFNFFQNSNFVHIFLFFLEFHCFFFQKMFVFEFFKKKNCSYFDILSMFERHEHLFWNLCTIFKNTNISILWTKQEN